MLTPEALPVLAAITLERDRQLAELGWTPQHDDEQGAAHLEMLAIQWEIHASHLVSADKRDSLVKAAALLVAAIEVLDRDRGTAMMWHEIIGPHEYFPVACDESGCVPLGEAPAGAQLEVGATSC